MNTKLQFGIVVFIILMLFLTVATQFVHAQSIDIDYDNCMVIASPNNFYWPFEVKTTHDPAIGQRITDKHPNAPNAQLAIDKPQTDKAEEATWISFKNFANQTATWEVQLDLEYLSESTENREVIVDMYSNNQQVNHIKLLQDGKNFCIVYNLQVTNPPHVWTDEEILSVSSSLTKDEFSANQREIAKMNVIVGDGQRFDNIQTAVLIGFAVVILVGSYKARDRIKVELKLIRFEREQLEEARLTLTMNDDYRNLKIKQGLLNMNIEKNRIYQDVISMFQVAFAKKDDGPLELAKDTFEKLPGTVIQPGHDIIQGNNMNWNDPSHPDYMPLPVEYDEQEEPEQPGIKERLSEIKDKLPFVGTKEKSFEEYTEDYLNTELEQFDSSVDKVAHLKEIWDERIKEANKDPNGVASREIEVIRKVWQELLI
jgi:hypothetical protein